MAGELSGMSPGFIDDIKQLVPQAWALFFDAQTRDALEFCADGIILA